jgi:S1-C subfamily serine protease
MKMNLKSNGSPRIGSWLFLLCFGPCSIAIAVTPEIGEYDVRRDSTVVAVEQVMPSVVNIATKIIMPVSDPFDRATRRLWGQRAFDEYLNLGSGVVIDEDGYLLTNAHVVKDATQIAVRFATGTNDYEATLVDSDANSDVALLKLKSRPGEKFHAIKLARENDLLLGETVLALGNPFGLGGSVTRGILSSKSRQVPKEGAPLDVPNWLQTDAPINHGNSGGPLVNLRGELIGINVAVVNQVNGEPAQGLGFAIPIALVEEALAFPTDVVRSNWFGARVKVGTLPLFITSVQPDSPAGRAGLKVGDAVTAVNGIAPKSFIDFGDLLATNATTGITLSVQRGTESRDITVRLVPIESVFNAEMIRNKLGLTLQKTPDGFVITDVQPGSPAGVAGLQKGILVRAVDGQTVPADQTRLARILYAKAKGEAVRLDLVLVERVGNFNILRQAAVNLVPR